MASLQLHVLKSSLSPFSLSCSTSSDRRRPKPCCFPFKYKSSPVSRTRVLRFRSSKFFIYPVPRFRICCNKLQDGDNQNQNNGEEPPESLFMKELKRRGMTPTSLLEENNRGFYGDEEMKIKEEGGFSKRNAVSTDVDRSLSNQRERSMALNSEGLEGLIPRAKLLLTIGGTFFFGFWPLILVTVAFFSTLYLYFGPSFIHDARNSPTTPSQYIDPYELLEDERISQIAPSLN